MMRLDVELCGLRLRNPVMPASGCFGYGLDYAEFYDPRSLGAIVTKGTTREARPGNVGIRCWETPSGMLNSIGLENPGIGSLRELVSGFVGEVPVIANVAGFATDDFAHCAAEAERAGASAVELNVSCPNTERGYLGMAADRAQVAEVVATCKRLVQIPVIVKLPPVSDLVALAQVCKDHGADGLTLINTVPALALNPTDLKPVFARRFAGLSGPAIRPVALKAVYEVYAETRMPIIGCGGVTTGLDALEFLACGARAIQVGSANFRDPLACPRVIAQLEQELETRGMEACSDAIGRAHEP